MKAIIYQEYGPPDVLQLQDIPKPGYRDDQVLVRVRAAAVNPYDWHFIRGLPYFMRLFVGLRGPRSKFLGLDFSGQVEAVGRSISEFQPGDEVFGMCEGAFAEYLSISENKLAHKPNNLTFEQAAAVPLAALTALQGLRGARKPLAGQKMLIVGASGGVGTFAVQLAKEFGAEVTGVCSSRNHELVRSLGAEHLIDYSRQDFTRGERKYDLIFQLAGTASPARCRRALTRQGTLILSSGDSSDRWIGPLDRIIKAAFLAPLSAQKLRSLDTKHSKEDLQYLATLLEGARIRPVIDRAYRLDEASEAIRYLEKGHARGKVVLTV